VPACLRAITCRVGGCYGAGEFAVAVDAVVADRRESLLSGCILEELW
jgi:hypothetical protein